MEPPLAQHHPGTAQVDGSEDDIAVGDRANPRMVSVSELLVTTKMMAIANMNKRREV